MSQENVRFFAFDAHGAAELGSAYLDRSSKGGIHAQVDRRRDSRRARLALLPIPASASFDHHFTVFEKLSFKPTPNGFRVRE
jgi:hypothetical protein